MKGFSLIIVLALLFLLHPAHCATYYVPDDFPTIQDAIDSASDGDEIIVRPGTYYEHIDFRGKAIYLHSEQGPEVTIIDGQGSWRCVTFSSGEGAVLEGFTLTNSSGGSGGAIYCYSSSPTITNNIIYNNSATNGGGIYSYNASPTIVNNIIHGNSANQGGGIYCNGDSATIANNVIYDNTATLQGGGIYCTYSSASIVNNKIYNNNATNGAGIYYADSTLPIANNLIYNNNASSNGGGLFCFHSSPDIVNNVFYNNYAGDYGGAIYCQYNSHPVLTNTIVFSNHASQGAGLYCDNTEPLPTARYCDFYQNHYCEYINMVPGPGFLFEDPLFVSPDNGDFRLLINSPCRDTGDPAILDPDGTISDMGAYGGPNAGWQSWTVSFASGWNLIAVSVERATYGYADGAFYNLLDNGNTIENSLFTYSPSLGYTVYPTNFTDVAPGLGYWLFITNPGDFTISGWTLQEELSLNLSLGWNLIGHPFTQPVLLSSCMVEHPTEGIMPIEDAVNNNWLMLPFYKYTPGSGYRPVSFIEPYEDNYLRPWTGYWVLTTADNLKLIIPPPAE